MKEMREGREGRKEKKGLCERRKAFSRKATPQRLHMNSLVAVVLFSLSDEICFFLLLPPNKLHL